MKRAYVKFIMFLDEEVNHRFIDEIFNFFYELHIPMFSELMFKLWELTSVKFCNYAVDLWFSYEGEKE